MGALWTAWCRYLERRVCAVSLKDFPPAFWKLHSQQDSPSSGMNSSPAPFPAWSRGSEQENAVGRKSVCSYCTDLWFTFVCFSYYYRTPRHFVLFIFNLLKHLSRGISTHSFWCPGIVGSLREGTRTSDHLGSDSANRATRESLFYLSPNWAMRQWYKGL